MKQYFEIFFNDGSRELAHGKRELNKLAKRFDFSVEEVLRDGDAVLWGDDGDPVGGVQKLNL